MDERAWAYLSPGRLLAAADYEGVATVTDAAVERTVAFGFAAPSGCNPGPSDLTEGQGEDAHSTDATLKPSESQLHHVDLLVNR